MLPEGSGVQVISYFDLKEQPSKTYYIDRENKRIMGTVTDYLKAVEQAVYLILSTERYDYVIYDHNYGIELKDLFGKDKYIACAVLERRIRDALSVDDRIVSLADFDFTVGRKSIYVKFTANTVYGDIEEEVNFNV